MRRGNREICFPSRNCSAPLIAGWLLGHYQTSFAIAVYIAVCAVITLIATALMTDYTGRNIEAARE